jgi:predicted metal-dependent enzyme (double-stranded beta helix superfamily)
MGQWSNGTSLFMTRTAAKLRESGISRDCLAEIAEDLRRLAVEVVFSHSDFPLARVDEEVVYELAEDAASGIALYLVSDAPGVRTPPHDHRTWAVIVGIEGIERHALCRVTDRQPGPVEAYGEAAVGEGDSLILLDDEIHSTEAIGPTATYHLHLYGRSLRALPSFEERTYVTM